ncbi:sugar ABC transporter ATP-binding protein [Euzebya rosea]|uniref:sugar ABC transporter ATP-binding protein n=1 Tax=Euzebya rosea TaxID=2052804 RepID=UPI0013009210|nr:sugar ABC transporter ATP-binding protein [Euzebya rosea]
MGTLDAGDGAAMATSSREGVARGARVELRAVHKRFGATQALADIDLEVEPGTIHALVGENGAGKSTLGKVVGGIHAVDEGQLLLDGETVGRWNAPTALEHRIATIQQELSLVPAMSVERNVFLGMEPSRAGALTTGMRERYEVLDATVGFGLDPRVPVRDLRLADQQKVEILRAIARDARLVVMDEPTSSLTQDEADRLHEIMDRLRREGRTIIYVSHFLDEVLRWADRVTIMRDGRIVRTADTAEETKDSLVEGMLGQPVELSFPQRVPVAPEAPVVLEVEGLSGGIVEGVDLQIRSGEVLGLAGLVGSGRTEIARLLFGADPASRGSIRVDGALVELHNPRAAIDAGVVMLPEDRRGQGLVMTQNVRENITLPRLGHFARFGSVRRGGERAATRTAIERLGITPARVNGELQHYSGGNQQKALFAKWTLRPPRVLILDEPTRGIDVGAKRRIYDALLEEARNGAAVLLISSELEEVVELSARVHLVVDGRITGEVDPVTADADEILKKLFGTAAADPRTPPDTDVSTKAKSS